MKTVICEECNGNQFCDYLMPNGKFERHVCESCEGLGIWCLDDDEEEMKQ